MKNFNLSILFLSIVQVIAAQTQQIYSGVYESGKATYQYYENEKSDRIYNGSFNYTGSIYTIAGNFKENLRTNNWKFTAKNKAFKNELGKLIINAGVSGNYTESMMTGEWLYSTSVKTYNPKTRKYNYKPENTASRANFENNYFTGNISYENGISSKTVFTGQFSKRGLPDGIWLRKSKLETEEIVYKDGILISRIVKNLATGDKKVNENYEDLLSKFWKNYDKKTNNSIIDGKMYIIDTVDFHNMAVDLWKEDLVSVQGFGNVLNPIYSFKREHTSPICKEIKIILCESNSDCYADYIKRKNEEQERVLLKNAQEAEKLRNEALAIEEQIRKEKEREFERQRVEKIAIAEKLGNDLIEQKKYRSALAQFNEVKKLSNTPKTSEKLNTCTKEVSKLDSLHYIKVSKYNFLKENAPRTFEEAYNLNDAVRSKKKVYSINYLMCLDYMKNNFNPKFNNLTHLETEKSSSFESWTDEQQIEFDEINTLTKQLEEVKAFYTNTSTAVAANNKTKMRILNSSLNPVNIIQDMNK